MALTRFSLTLYPGSSRVEVDGRDVSSQVEGLQVHAQGGHLPRLLLELVPDGEIQGEAVVQVFHVDGDWLAHLDPTQLEAEVTAAMDAFAGESYTAALLRRLQEIARAQRS